MEYVDPVDHAVKASLHSWIRASILREGLSMKTDGHKGSFPWGTKGDLNRVGDKLRNNIELTENDARILDVWRESHFHVMNAFQAMLRNRTKKLPITVAQRHKRRVTIIDKLSREPSMQLARMDDVAGIRLIFPDLKSMSDFRSEFLASKHKHNKKNHDDKYNYIISVKATGYRGIHDIYSYHSDLPSHAKFNGTMIEVQYRTIHTHAWATANEVVTMTLGQKTKFNKADGDYIEYFRLASEIFARAFDGMPALYPLLSTDSIVSKFNEIDERIRVTDRLGHLNIARNTITKMDSGVVLRFSNNGNLTVHPVPRFQKAMEFYFNIEKSHPDDDVVLVNSSEAGHIRSAYRNYFSDTTQFLDFLELGKTSI